MLMVAVWRMLRLGEVNHTGRTWSKNFLVSSFHVGTTIPQSKVQGWRRNVHTNSVDLPTPSKQSEFTQLVPNSSLLFKWFKLVCILVGRDGLWVASKRMGVESR